MKKFLKKVVPVTLSLCLVLNTCAGAASVFAEEKGYENEGVIASINTTNEVASYTRSIENEMIKNHTSVSKELVKLIATIDQEMENEKDPQEIEKLAAFKSSTENLLNTYEQSTQFSAMSAHYNSYAVRASSVEEAALAPAIAAVVSYFSLKGYMLSAELLMHAQDNDSLDSNYQPYFGNRVHASQEFRDIKIGSSTSGTGNFRNRGSVIERDLYYGIHLFEYEKSGSQVVIKDRYDFAYGDYDGLAGIAVNTMYLAQELGVITPFYTIIVE